MKELSKIGTNNTQKQNNNRKDKTDERIESDRNKKYSETKQQ